MSKLATLSPGPYFRAVVVFDGAGNFEEGHKIWEQEKREQQQLHYVKHSLPTNRLFTSSPEMRKLGENRRKFNITLAQNFYGVAFFCDIPASLLIFALLSPCFFLEFQDCQLSFNHEASSLSLSSYLKRLSTLWRAGVM